VSQTEWRAFSLYPDDVLFFRDGRPSTRGADHYLRSLFPPSPSTLYGAVRTRRLMDEGIELEGLNAHTWKDRLGGLAKELGDWGGFGSLRLRGPWLVWNGEPLLPAPHDLGIEVDTPEDAKAREIPRVARAVRYIPVAFDGNVIGSHPLAGLQPHDWEGLPGTEPPPALGWFLRPAGFAAWSRGGMPKPEDFVHWKTLWVDESRTGVGLETKGRLAAKGQLYTFGFIRLRPGVALGFEASGTELKPGGRLRLGGEGRTVALEKGSALPEPPLQLPVSGRLTLSFATPALSEAGAYPPGFSEGRLSSQLGEKTCSLVAAAVRGFTTLGGWDLAKGQAKPLRRAIPAGSVFLFEAPEGPPETLHGQCLSDFPGDHLAQQGFGLAMAGISL
jgi:CRISPR-associated protein Cmr3